MAYNDFLTGNVRKESIWLYEITTSATTYRYLGAQLGLFLVAPTFTYDSQTWSPEAISHGEIRHGVDLEKLQVAVRIPTSSAIGQARKGRQPILADTIRILHGFKNDPDGEFVVKYTGKLASVRSGKIITTLTFENGLSRLREAVATETIQASCRHRLYSDNCGAVKASFTTSETASAIDGQDVTVAAAAGQDDHYYTSGLITYGGEERWIIKHIGDTITMETPFAALETALGGGSVSVDLSAGCLLSRTVCNDRFSNIENYGGFPFISNNPFTESVF